MCAIVVDESGAFVEWFELPPTREGALIGLRFAVKDIIDVAARRTGCGNPTWREAHSAAVVSAVCVEQLLTAGARCDGKTVTDEFAFSIVGENHWYGTPLNPAAPDRVPGGSSSGSASAVACGLVDFALGTDTGGSVRIPASNCGIWGWRPTHGVVSVAGVMPLAPSFDTVGILASSCDVLRRAARVLTGEQAPSPRPSPRERGSMVYLLNDAFALTDADVPAAIAPAIDSLREFADAVREISIGELCGDAEAGDLRNWIDTYRALLAAEVGSTIGNWVFATKPALGPAAARGFEFVRSIDRTRIGESIERRERFCERLRNALGPRDLLCLPTTPAIAPLKGTSNYDRSGDYYQRTGSLQSIAGIGRLPQVSMPVANVNGAPIGLSLVSGPNQDSLLLDLAARIATSLGME